jgi:hypothetical protein
MKKTSTLLKKAVLLAAILCTVGLGSARVSADANGAPYIVNTYFVRIGNSHTYFYVVEYSNGDRFTETVTFL